MKLRGVKWWRSSQVTLSIFSRKCSHVRICIIVLLCISYSKQLCNLIFYVYFYCKLKLGCVTAEILISSIYFLITRFLQKSFQLSCFITVITLFSPGWISIPYSHGRRQLDVWFLVCMSVCSFWGSCFLFLFGAEGEIVTRISISVKNARPVHTWDLPNNVSAQQQRKTSYAISPFATGCPASINVFSNEYSLSTYLIRYFIMASCLSLIYRLSLLVVSAIRRSPS